MRRAIRGRSGFTLIEILVVVMIASIILAVLASVLGSSFEVLRTGESRAKMNNNVRAAINYLCADISNASGIPLARDRDLNGFPDDDQTYGYDQNATWLVAYRDVNNQPVVPSSYYISEAWQDRIMLSHENKLTGGANASYQGSSTPKVLIRSGLSEVVEWTSFFRLAIPASGDMPYYLAGECDRDGSGTIIPGELLNTGVTNGTIYGYPELVPVGLHKETAVLIEDLFYKRLGDEFNVGRERQIPVASNITGLKFEYMHEVPVYMSRINGNDIEIAYQNPETGEVTWFASASERDNSMEGFLPIISRWDLRIIDVAYDTDFVDAGTTAEFIGTYTQLRDQYPEGLDVGKLDGTHVVGQSSVGLGMVAGAGHSGWTCSAFYNIDCAGGQNVPDNAPIDRLAYVTTGLDGSGNPVETGIAMIRPDTEVIHGGAYYSYTTNPTDLGDLGDADGIPDGDGIPDNPVPAWWLPYVKAVRVTVTATPRRIIEERRSQSGLPAKGGNPADAQGRVWYRLDSPVPFADANRIIPLANQREDYIGIGQDVVMTRTVPVSFDYSKDINLAYDPADARLSDNFLRRVELNYFQGANRMFYDPVGPYERIRATTPVTKLDEKDPL